MTSRKPSEVIGNHESHSRHDFPPRRIYSRGKSSGRQGGMTFGAYQKTISGLSEDQSKFPQPTPSASPIPSHTGVAHRSRTAQRAARRTRFLMAYRMHRILRIAFAKTGERWVTVCGMCRDPAFRAEFHALMDASRVLRYSQRNLVEHRFVSRVLRDPLKYLPAEARRAEYQRTMARMEYRPIRLLPEQLTAKDREWNARFK